MRATVLLLLLIVPVPTAGAQTTRPVALEARAQQALLSGDYENALVLYNKLAVHYADDADRLGPVQEQIRFLKRRLKMAKDAPTSAPATMPARKAHARPAAGSVLDIDIKDLGNFTYDSQRGGNVPADVISLSGVRLRTRGFMVPLDQVDNITQFALVPSLFACCFGLPPQANHTILVHVPGKGVGYYDNELVVEGTLRVEEKKDDGYVVSLFELESTSVRPVRK